MAPLLATCPNTGKSFPTNIRTDAKSLAKSWKSVMRVHCPYCLRKHKIIVREAFLNSDLLT